MWKRMAYVTNNECIKKGENKAKRRRKRRKKERR